MKTKPEGIVAIDIKIADSVKSDIVAYYRLPTEMKKFLEKCQEKNLIIGFEWDGKFRFGVILKDSHEA